MRALTQSVSVPEAQQRLELRAHSRLLERLSNRRLSKRLASVQQAARELPLRGWLAAATLNIAAPEAATFNDAGNDVLSFLFNCLLGS